MSAGEERGGGAAAPNPCAEPERPATTKCLPRKRGRGSAGGTDLKVSQEGAAGSATCPARMSGAEAGGCGGRSSCGTEQEIRHIGAARQAYLAAVETARSSVIMFDEVPQPAGLHPDDRIGLGVELLVVAERHRGDGESLQPVGPALERFGDDESQKRGQARRGQKSAG